MTNYFPESYTRGARLLKELTALKPGECYRMTATMLSDIEVPANPLDQQTPEYLAEWMKVRMPFYCTMHRDTISNWWDICRPPSALGE